MVFGYQPSSDRRRVERDASFDQRTLATRPKHQTTTVRYLLTISGRSASDKILTAEEIDLGVS